MCSYRVCLGVSFVNIAILLCRSKRYGHVLATHKILMEHMYKPVKWEQTMQTLYQRREGEGFPKTDEVGPGTQLGVILKMINRKAHESYTHIDV